METILVIDTGSSSMRGVLFSLYGSIMYIKQIPYTMTVGTDGSATMEAQIFKDCLLTICRNIAQEIKLRGYTLLAVSLDSQRSSVLAVDGQLRPLYPTVMWYDKRCVPICASFSRETLRNIYMKCGMRLTPVSSAPKMLWLKQHHQDIYDKAFKLIGIHDYLLYELTGNLVTDATCACRSALMDIRNLDWSQELLSIFGIDQEKLCRILRPASIAGCLTKDWAAQTGLPVVPVVSAGGDQQCCLLGQHSAEAGVISVNSGSASYLAIPVRTPIQDEGMEVNLSTYFGAYPWVLEAANMGSGTVYQWFNKNFYNVGATAKDMSQINEDVTMQPPGCNGLICFADFAGRGCPQTDPNARGKFLNVGLQHTRGSFARAILEGICFDIYGIICYMQSLGVEIRKIQSTGGLTKFPAFNQILADISGMEVCVNTCSETTALGAFHAGLSAIGEGEPSRIAGRESAQCFVPDKYNHELYAALGEERKQYQAKEFS